MASSHKVLDSKQESLSVDKVLNDLIEQVFNLIPEKQRGKKKLFDSLGGAPLLLTDIPSNEKYATDFLCAQYEALLIIRNEQILKITDTKLKLKLVNPLNDYSHFFSALREIEDKDAWGKLHPVIIDDKTFALGKALQVFADQLLTLKTPESLEDLLNSYSKNSRFTFKSQIKIYDELFSKQKEIAQNNKSSDYRSSLNSQINSLYQENPVLRKMFMEKVNKLFETNSQANTVKNQDEKKQTQTGNSKMTAALAKPPMGLPPKKPLNPPKNTTKQDEKQQPTKNNKPIAAPATPARRPVPPPPRQLLSPTKK